MDLIEQLGGYERAKDGLHRLKLEKKDLLTRGDLVVVESEIDAALLEHRRANNIFEVGDSIVIHENHDSTFMPVLEILEDCGDYFKTDNGIATKSHVGYWRHATDEEIKAGKRLEVESEN